MIGKISDKREAAKDTLQITFEVEEDFTFQSGQFIFITLDDLKYPDERGKKRHFSINNSPNQKGIIIITIRMRDTGFKKTLKELPLGTEVQLGPIAGNFVLPSDQSKPLVLIAGGIGITPFISMLRFIKEKNLKYQITLVYSNRDKSSSIFLQELQALSNSLPNFKLILTMTEDNGWKGEKRKIDSVFIKDYFPEVNQQHYMVVGPPPMVEAVEKALSEAGVEKSNIEIENFTGY